MSYSLRDLPLPVKVVASVFLMAVGVGYTSAMVQLHMQDAKSGKPMPTVDDVILKFTGKKKFDPNAPRQAPVSRLEALVMAETVAISGQSMSAAFTTEDRAAGPFKFKKAIEGKSPEQRKEIEEQRKGEQLAFKLWINAPEAERKSAYEADKFVPPAGTMPGAFTPALADGSAVQVRSIIKHRCVTCHSKGGEKEDVPLDTYEGLAKFMAADAPAPTGDWVKVEEPISTTKLTQSTHAHLLSFAVLFSLTGLIFALTDYPKTMRVIGGPWVVLAVFADVSLWWLARLCDQWGPYFAMGVIGTGMLVGAGLFGQIVLSLFNMYGPKGKIVVGGLLVAGGVISGLMWVNVFEPGLRAKEQALKKEDKPKEEPKKDDKQTVQPAEPKKKDTKEPGPKVDDKKGPGVTPKGPPKSPPSWAENLLTFPVKDKDGKVLPMEETPWTGGEDGNMARAFYDKDKVFKEFMADAAHTKADKDKLTAERDGERLALIAWVRATEPARKAAYDDDAFPLPAELTGKPITDKFLKDGKVAVKTIIANRCLRCHGPDGKQYDEYPLDAYDKWKKYVEPPAGAAAPAPEPPAVAAAPMPAAPPTPVPVPAPKPVEPIPAAKDD